MLITSDSILHALHRSYDQLLKQLETHVFSAVLEQLLERAHADLARRGATLKSPALARSAQDVDVYLTVARKLLLGDRGATVTSRFKQDDTVKRLLADVASLRLLPIPLYGGHRRVDFSQFKPRGHYTQSPLLQSYFRALMWLGRADTGFVLVPPPPSSGMEVDVERERRTAALLALILRDSGGDRRLQAIGQVLDLLVGRSDSLTVPQMLAALDRAKVRGPEPLKAASTLDRIQRELASIRPGGLQIRSQVLMSDPGTSAAVETPGLFQMFGQRFVLDSFVLSKVVFDTIAFKDEKIERWMPSGLDVMAALGNDEATRLLGPEIEKRPLRRQPAGRPPGGGGPRTRTLERQRLHDLAGRASHAGRRAGGRGAFPRGHAPDCPGGASSCRPSWRRGPSCATTPSCTPPSRTPPGPSASTPTASSSPTPPCSCGCGCSPARLPGCCRG